MTTKWSPEGRDERSERVHPDSSMDWPLNRAAFFFGRGGMRTRGLSYVAERSRASRKR